MIIMCETIRMDADIRNHRLIGLAMKYAISSSQVILLRSLSETGKCKPESFSDFKSITNVLRNEGHHYQLTELAVS
jgi:hypothetical protein